MWLLSELGEITAGFREDKIHTLNLNNLFNFPLLSGPLGEQKCQVATGT